MEKLLICGLELAKILNIDNSSLKRLREQRGLPFVRHGRRYMYSLDATKEWVRAQTQSIAQPKKETAT